MAELNFPQDRTELVPPGSGALQTGDEYKANGTTWIYDAVAGAWGSGGSGDSLSDLYLSKVNDDTAAGAITFEGQTTHEGGVSVTGGAVATVSTGISGTDSTQLRLNHDGETAAYFSKNNVIFHGSAGGAGSSNSGLLINTDIKGFASAYGMRAQGVIQNDVTDTGAAFFSRIGTAAGTAVQKVYQYQASFGGNNGSVENSVGFIVNNTIEVGTVRNIGFQSDLRADGNKNYNLYFSGSAPSYYAGDVEIATRIRAIAGIHFFGGSTRFGNESRTNFGESNQDIGVGISGADGQVFCSTNNPRAPIFLNRNDTGPAISLRRQGIEVGTINVQSDGVVLPPPPSDYRLKENVSSFAAGSATEKVNQLKPTLFSYKSDEKSEIIQGFIAHEVAEVVPYAVKGEKDEVDEAGNPVYQGVWSERLIPLLTKALQETLDKIETLETRLNDAGIA